MSFTRKLAHAATFSAIGFLATRCIGEVNLEETADTERPVKFLQRRKPLGGIHRGSTSAPRFPVSLSRDRARGERHTDLVIERILRWTSSKRTSW